MMTHQVQLRDVSKDDLPIFFAQQLDDEANQMAAFTVKDPGNKVAFYARWMKILTNDEIIKQTILCQGQVAGHIIHFEQFGDPAVGYWLGKAYWGRGIATQALSTFLQQIPTRPLYARAAKDNVASVRVLQKCDFVIVGEDTGFANARGAEIEEYILMIE